ncbi:MAG: hypothetical protein HQL32_17410, partial [Planctomycetes bacterium]|nr:hypothetical protein [Planctomycetota bacterium]
MFFACSKSSHSGLLASGTTGRAEESLDAGEELLDAGEELLDAGEELLDAGEELLDAEDISLSVTEGSLGTEDVPPATCAAIVGSPCLGEDCDTTEAFGASAFLEELNLNEFILDLTRLCLLLVSVLSGCISNAAWLLE